MAPRAAGSLGFIRRAAGTVSTHEGVGALREKEQGCLCISDAHVCISMCEREGRGEEGCVCNRGEEGGEGETDRQACGRRASLTLPSPHHAGRPSSSRCPTHCYLVRAA